MILALLWKEIQKRDLEMNSDHERAETVEGVVSSHDRCSKIRVMQTWASGVQHWI